MNKKLSFIIFLITLFLLSMDVYSADFYWRKIPANNNYHDIANWSIDASGEGSYPGSPPSSGDNVYFNNPSTIKNLTSSSIITMRNLTSTVDPSEKFTISSTPSVEISGNININGNFEIASTINVTLTAFTTHSGAEMNTGGVPFVFGRYLSIEMPNETFILKSDLILINTSILKLNTNFISNGYDITAASFSNGLTSGNAYRTINLGGSTITANGTSTNTTLELVGDSYTTLNTSTTDLVLESSHLRFFTYSETPYTLNSITFNSTTGTQTIYTSHNSSALAYTNVIVDKLIVNTPNLRVTTGNQYFNELTVNNLVITTKTNIFFEEPSYIGTSAINTTFKTKNIDIQPNGCLNQSSFAATLGVTMENIGNSTLVFDNMLVSGFFFTGNFGWQSLKSNDGGGNSGAITWITNYSKNYYWRGGTGDWNDPNYWYVDGIAPDGCIPTSNDDVYFDANSFSSACDVVTVDNGSCRNIYWSAANGRGSLVPFDKKNSLLNITGDVDFSGISAKGVKVNLFLGGLTGNTITSLVNDTTYACEFIYIKGNYSLTNDFYAARKETGYAPTTLYHLSGIFNSNGKNIYLGTFKSQSPSANDVRVLNLENSIIDFFIPLNSGITNTLLLNQTYLQSYNFNNSTFSLDSEKNTGVVTLYINLLGSFNFDRLICPTNKSTTSFTTLESSTQTFKWLEFHEYAGFNTSSSTIKADTLVLASGINYSLSRLMTLQVSDSIIILNADCSDIANITCTSTSRAYLSLDKAMSVKNVSLKNINVNSNHLTITSGIDNGGNTGNFTIIPPQPKDYYWVGGSGYWSDPLNWNILVNGVLQPTICIPGPVDNVYFDGNSFSNSGETVYLDATRIEVHSMTWLPQAGEKSPVLNFYTSKMSLYINGSLEFTEGMAVTNIANGEPYILFTPTETGNYYDSKNINANALRFSFNTKYDFEIRNSITCSYLNMTSKEGAVLNVNGNYVNCSGTCSLYPETNGKIDITNSVLNLGYFSATSSTPSSMLLTQGAEITASAGFRLNNSSAFQFKKIELTGDLKPIEMNPSYLVSMDSLIIHQNATITGNISSGVVQYKKLGTSQIINAGSTLAIRNQIIYDASPCELFKLSSSVTSAGGENAIVRYEPCNLNLMYVELTNIRFDATGLTCTPNIQVLGNFYGENREYVSVIPLLSVDGSFIDTIMYCANMPLDVELIGIGNPASITWYYEDVLLPELTDRFITVDSIGDYKAAVSYTQSNGLPCAIESHVILRQIIDTVAPTFTVKDTTVYVTGCTSSFLNSTTNCDLRNLYESCNMGNIWYRLTGATTADSIPGTLNGVTFNYGTTLVTAYASDSIPSKYYPDTVSVPAPNIGSATFNITVTDLANTIAITCANTNAISGTAGAIGGSVSIYEDINSNPLGTSTVETDRTWVIPISKHNLPVGTEITARLNNNGCFTDSDQVLIQGLNCGLNIPDTVEKNTQIIASTSIIYVNYKWSITSGKAEIVGADNTSSVVINVNNGSFTIRLESVDNNSCYTVCEKTVFVESLHNLNGTVFPFVESGDPELDKLFITTASLYLPPTSANPFNEIKASTPLYTDTLVLYDGSVYVPGTPRYPGVIANTNNPGVPISWKMVGKEPGNIDNTEVGVGEKPQSDVGLFTFTDVQAGEYLLVISRPGYMTRYAKINITEDGTLGHRELLAGDINNDGSISVTDLSLLKFNFAIYNTDPSYKALYDLDGNGYINFRDIEITQALLRAGFLMYTDSYDWLINY